MQWKLQNFFNLTKIPLNLLLLYLIYYYFNFITLNYYKPLLYSSNFFLEILEQTVFMVDLFNDLTHI